jgi:hypothetical protein
LADAKMYQEKRQRHDGRHTAVRAG